MDRYILKLETGFFWAFVDWEVQRHRALAVFRLAPFGRHRIVSLILMR